MKKKSFYVGIGIGAVLAIIAAVVWTGVGISKGNKGAKEAKATDVGTCSDAAGGTGCFAEDWTATEVLGVSRCAQPGGWIDFTGPRVAGTFGRISSAQNIEEQNGGTTDYITSYGRDGVVFVNGLPENCRVNPAENATVTKWHVDGIVH
ncbi:MAG: hypothetical protein NTZ65_04375 [Candidatus Berkelbacteria bacterium]|nr:hypothetical protein [Candidatus Berkelbacteria bacterium]